jgi:hypothetical protein
VAVLGRDPPGVHRHTPKVGAQAIAIAADVVKFFPGVHSLKGGRTRLLGIHPHHFLIPPTANFSFGVEFSAVRPRSRRC